MAERMVWKFPVSQAPEFEFSLDLPAGAELLHVATQGFGEQSVMSLWALVDPDAETEMRRFMLVPTGHPLPGPGRYIGTFTVNTTIGQLWWHLFEAGHV